MPFGANELTSVHVILFNVQYHTLNEFCDCGLNLRAKQEERWQATIAVR